ncbi:VirK/YbjX family protein [Testudinibacter sp. P80/BLE/0925]|uniref:VirK/YbjX family protein n=1 Tax=Testudinibacter sp. TW-1 TaxID=3417757 RepID=UPI003D362077
MKNTITFPTAKTMFPATNKKRSKLALIRSRYYLRYARSAKYCNKFVCFLNNHALWQTLFRENPYRFNSILYRFCDKRFGPKQRLAALQYNFAFAETVFGETLCRDLVKHDSVLITTLANGISAYLNINKIDPLEGFFSINLQDENQQRLYDLSFAFIPESRLLITSLQGPSGEMAQDLVRKLTKQLHGVRPSHMLITIIKMLAETWGCKLLGIKHKNQAKYRWNDHSRLLFNYDQFWAENGAEFDVKSQYWQLSTALERKSLEEVQSKKRSMYRKRYDMLDHLQIAANTLYR